MADDPEILLRELRELPQRPLVEGDAGFEELIAKAMRLIETPSLGLDLPLDIRTAFQRRVWKALQQIPAGVTASYVAIARRIAVPNGSARWRRPAPLIRWRLQSLATARSGATARYRVSRGSGAQTRFARMRERRNAHAAPSEVNSVILQSSAGASTAACCMRGAVQGKRNRGYRLFAEARRRFQNCAPGTTALANLRRS